MTTTQIEVDPLSGIGSQERFIVSFKKRRAEAFLDVLNKTHTAGFSCTASGTGPQERWRFDLPTGHFVESLFRAFVAGTSGSLNYTLSFDISDIPIGSRPIHPKDWTWDSLPLKKQ